jgi:DNA (cytosine-5)-methyltransferase 1
MTFLDICAGIGGFRLGMEQAGHKCVGFIEKDKFAVKSYRAIHNTQGEFYHDDIFTVCADALPAADIWCFGFPCQAFSNNGLRRGFQDRRGTIILKIFELAKIRKPKVLFAENVRGLLSNDKGQTFAQILLEMDKLGYDVQWQIINSKHYLPQHRVRIYIIGTLRGTSEQEVFPILQERKETSLLSTDYAIGLTVGYGNQGTSGTYIGESKVNKAKENEQISTCITTESNNSRGTYIATSNKRHETTTGQSVGQRNDKSYDNNRNVRQHNTKNRWGGGTVI